MNIFLNPIFCLFSTAKIPFQIPTLELPLLLFPQISGVVLCWYLTAVKEVISVMFTVSNALLMSKAKLQCIVEALDF